jgi:type II secretory pathway component PulM
MTRWRWKLEVLAVRHGLWLLPGLGLFACALFAWYAWLPGQEAAVRDAELALAQARRVAPPQLSATMQAAPLPPAALASGAVQRLFALAREHGLQVMQAEYRRQDVGKVGRWQVQMPASGTYPQLRSFLRAAQALPGLSVDEVGLHRGGAGGEVDARGDARVEARLLLSIWYSTGAAAAQAGGYTSEPEPASSGEPAPDLFAAVAGRHQTALVAETREAAAPQVPALTRLGFKEEDGVRQAYIEHGGDVLSAGAGTLLARRYRVTALRHDTVEIRDIGSGAVSRIGFKDRE